MSELILYRAQVLDEGGEHEQALILLEKREKEILDKATFLNSIIHLSYEMDFLR
jgi:hypothetical protein